MIILRACFGALADDLHAELAGDSKHQPLYEHHARQIRQLFARQPDLPLHQDSVGGFLYGFLTVRAHYVPQRSLEQQAMFPVLCGTLLLARELPTGDRDRTAGYSFICRLVAGIDEYDLQLEYDPRPGAHLVLEAFRVAGDIPLTCATLGGFSLGVAYTHPYLPPGASDPASMVAAACELAHALAR
jgi:hypothetical protein